MPCWSWISNVQKSTAESMQKKKDKSAEKLANKHIMIPTNLQCLVLTS